MNIFHDPPHLNPLPPRDEGTISPLALDGREAGGEGENVKGNNSNLLKNCDQISICNR
jgi:hypothetical protein